MASVLYSAFLIAISLEWISVECCYNNQRVGFCSRARKVFEGVCPDVSYRDCNYFTLRCGCVRNTFRNKEGKCVAKSECDPQVDCTRPCSDDSAGRPGRKDQATKPNLPLKPAQPQEPSSSGDEVPKTQEGELVATQTPPLQLEYPVSSIGTKGCPDDSNTCRSECQKRHFPDGMCDSLVPIFCLCSGHKPTQGESPSRNLEETPKTWPYGQVVDTGDQVFQLEDDYGCQKSKTDCISTCRGHGFFRVFCEHGSNRCFCWAQASEYNWREPMGKEEKILNQDQSNCTSQAICNGACLSRQHRGGFCTEDPTSMCYCYDMYRYDSNYRRPSRTPQLPTYDDFTHQAKQFFGAGKTLLLARISVSAWMGSECNCMDSTLVGSEGDEIQRTVKCRGEFDTENGTLLTNVETTVKFSVSMTGGATQLTLSAEGGTLPFGLLGSYNVLTAHSTCAVVQIGDVIKGRPLCAMWKSRTDGYGDEELCKKTMENSCLNPFFEADRHKDQCS